MLSKLTYLSVFFFLLLLVACTENNKKAEELSSTVLENKIRKTNLKKINASEIKDPAQYQNVTEKEFLRILDSLAVPRAKIKEVGDQGAKDYYESIKKEFEAKKKEFRKKNNQDSSTFSTRP